MLSFFDWVIAECKVSQLTLLIIHLFSYFTQTSYLTQPTQESVPAEVTNEPAYMELRSNYLPTAVNTSNAHDDPPTSPSTVNTDNSTHSSPLNGYVTGDHEDVSW